MADVSVVAAEVLPASDTQYANDPCTAGAAITAGQTLYFDTSAGTWKLADANASATTAVVSGIAMNSVASGQILRVATGGTIDPGFTVDVGKIYVLSGTAGGIAPSADLATGMYTGIVGVGITASSLKLLFIRSGVAWP